MLKYTVNNTGNNTDKLNLHENSTSRQTYMKRTA